MFYGFYDRGRAFFLKVLRVFRQTTYFVECMLYGRYDRGRVVWCLGYMGATTEDVWCAGCTGVNTNNVFLCRFYSCFDRTCVTAQIVRMLRQRNLCCECRWDIMMIICFMVCSLYGCHDRGRVVRVVQVL